MVEKNSPMRWVAVLGVMAALGPGGSHVLGPPTARAQQPNPVILFVADGVRQDMMEELAAEGKLPNYQALLEQGVDGGKGLIPSAPAVTAPNWATLATGLSPGKHGAVDNWFYDNRRDYPLIGIDGFQPWSHLGESIAATATSQGKTVLSAGFKTIKLAHVTRGAAFDVTPVLLSDRGVITNYEIPVDEPLVGCLQNLSRQHVEIKPATSWTRVPRSYSPARETKFAMTRRLSYQVYIYDSTDDAVTNYDRVVVSPTKNGDRVVADLAAGQWSQSITTLPGLRLGQFYIKLIDLEPDLSTFRLYFTGATRLKTRPYQLAGDLISRFDGVTMWYDYCPMLMDMIDEQTFVEQVLMYQKVMGEQILPYLIEVYKPDLVLAGTPSPDIIEHVFFGRAMGEGDPVARGYIDQAIIGADQMLGNLRAAMPTANIIATSDHGFSVVRTTIAPHKILQGAGLYNPRNRLSSAAIPIMAGNGGCAHVYVNLAGRNPRGVVPPDQYDSVRARIVAAFEELGPDLIYRILLKEETAAIPTDVGVEMNMLHPYHTGDVVLFSTSQCSFNPPWGPNGFESVNAGDHGFLPLDTPEHYAMFAAAGPDIVPGRVIDRITALDMVPTLAFALGIDPPQGIEGRELPLFTFSPAP